jgi:hypothetical protein
MNTQVETFPFTVCSHTDYWQDLSQAEALEAAKKLAEEVRAYCQERGIAAEVLIAPHRPNLEWVTGEPETVADYEALIQFCNNEFCGCYPELEFDHTPEPATPAIPTPFLSIPKPAYSLNRFYTARSEVLELVGKSIRALDPQSLRDDAIEDIQFWYDRLVLYRGIRDELKRVEMRLDCSSLLSDKLVVLEYMNDEFSKKAVEEPKYMYLSSIFHYVSGLATDSVWGPSDVE